ncbi:MAG: hypothetical protein IJR58_04385 [Lachnospiraceae bacterium]|nr:hypothetical protein [Lachnospiraceae bacterium]
MTEKKSTGTYLCIAVAAVVALMIAIGAGLDYYLDLNDDVLIKNITSGAYTGVPEAHNIQMLYPAGLLLSLLYKIAPGLNWYALFLSGIQFACLCVILFHSLSFVQIDSKEKRARRIITCLLILCIFVTLTIPHLVILQYTFTCAMLSGTAAFLVLVTKGRGGLVASALLLTLAFVIRSEMMLLTLPMVACTYLYRLWNALKEDRKEAEESGTGTKRMSKETGELVTGFAVLCVCMGISMVQQGAGYGRSDWKEFMRLFDARTELYDFHTIPTYEEDAAFFDENGIGEAESVLLSNYNFGLSESIDAELMEKAAEYMTGKEKETGLGVGKSFGAALGEYFYRLRHIAMPESYPYPQTDAPWNLITILFYAAVLLLYMMPEEPQVDEDGTVAILSASAMRAIVPKLILFFLVRSALWMFLLMRGRDPVRVTHGLYFVEVAILFAMLLNRIHIFLGIEISKAVYAKMPETKRRRGPDGKKLPVTYADAVQQKRWNWDNVTKVKSFRMAMAFMLTMITISFLSVQIIIAQNEGNSREEINKPYNELFAYMKQAPENTYLLDVYSFVPYTEKAFENVDNRYMQYEFLGGWAAKSPLVKQRDILTTLAEEEHVYYVARTTSLSEAQGDAANTKWLVDYAQEQGMNITVEKTDTVADTFYIYDVTK